MVTDFNAPPVWTSPAPGSLGTLTGANLNLNALSTVSFAAEDPENGPVVYAVVGGALPPGLSLTTSGQLVGTVRPELTPANSCGSLSRNYTFTVAAQDGVHGSPRTFWIVVSVTGTFRTITYSAPGPFTWTAPGSVPLTADVLVVGGGGAGGSRHAGGGGGGGVLFRTGVAFQPNEAVTGQVGAGGVGIAGPGPGNSGGNSQLGLLLALGERCMYVVSLFSVPSLSVLVLPDLP